MRPSTRETVYSPSTPTLQQNKLIASTDVSVTRDRNGGDGDVHVSPEDSKKVIPFDDMEALDDGDKKVLRDF